MAETRPLRRPKEPRNSIAEILLTPQTQWFLKHQNLLADIMNDNIN
jgi:hypothetical protein